MHRLVEEDIIPELQREGIEFWTGRNSNMLVIPLPVALEEDNYENLFITLTISEAGTEIAIAARLGVASARRRTRAALLLAELNAGFKYVVFAMVDGVITLDNSVDLRYTANRRAAIMSALERLVAVTRRTFPMLWDAADMRSRVERDVEEIMKRAGT